MKDSAIVLENITREYPGGVRAVNKISATIGAGEWVTLAGPSGSGKSTLLNLIEGLDRPTSGRIHVLGRDTTELTGNEAATFRRENLGLVFQQFHLIPYLTALENVMVAQYYHSLVDQKQAEHVLKIVQMADRAHHLPSQLSGGEQQRVCIARALINEPKIVLADEPTANLDEVNERIVLDLFQRLHDDGRTLVIATHDATLSGRAERILSLRHGHLVDEKETDARTIGAGVS